MANWKTRVAALALGIACLAFPAAAEDFQLLSGVDPAQGPPSGGSGDSWGPVLSADGRYVLFASTANNLLLASNQQPIQALFPPVLNAYLRERTNGVTSLVSVNLTGVAGGNGDSLPVSISTDGRYALFESSASDLVTGDTNKATDIFVRDLLDGTTLLVSVSTNGRAGNGASRNATMTPDGRYVAFVSAANNLVAGDTNRIADVFLRDLQLGQTLLVSDGAKATNLYLSYGSSEAPELTPDGRFVAFSSTATNLVPGVTNIGDVYVRDVVQGTTAWASSYARTAVPSNSVVAFNHAISADGRYVAYEACSTSAWVGKVLRYDTQTGQTEIIHTNAAVQTPTYEDAHSLEMTPDGRYVVFVANTNGANGATTCVLQWDAQTGLATLVSGNLSNQVPAGSMCQWPTPDSSGRYVAFLSSAPNLVTNTVVGEFHLYLRDVVGGTTTLISAGTNRVGSTAISPVTMPRLSADGQFVAFESPDAGYVAGDRNRDVDVFVRDMAAGASELISVRLPSLSSLTANGPSTLGGPGALSRDGRYLAFASDADNLARNDTNGCRDIFVRDLAGGTNVLVSVTTNGFSPDSISGEPYISPDGRFVGFTSIASNLVGADINLARDVFLRDLQTGVTILVSRNALNTPGRASGNQASYSPTVSAGGRYVLFRSKATDLVPGVGGTENLFLRDVQAGTTYALTTNGVGVQPAAMTPDGSYVAYAGGIYPPPTYSYLYVWSTAAGRRIYTNSLGGASTLYRLAITPDGRRVAYSFNSGTRYLSWANPLTGSANTVETSQVAYGDMRFSADGRYLACAHSTTSASTMQIYLYDLVAGTSTLVSHMYSDIAERSSGTCDYPDLTPDGRFVAYRSSSTNLVAADTNGVPDIYLYDRLTGLNTLLTADRLGGMADNRSTLPIFSGDGQTLAFQSWASDFVAGDFNHHGDLFAYTLLVLSLAGDPNPGQGPWLWWPVMPGKSYRVQSKASLADPDWQDVSGSIGIQGTKAFLRDLNPSVTQKFYRLLAN